MRRQRRNCDRTCLYSPIVTECETCGGARYNKEALACTYKGKNIVELLELTASQALELFEDARIGNG